MAGVFSKQDDTKKVDRVKRKSIFEEVAEELMRKPTYIPEEVPMKALFYGADGTGKSGTALSLVDKIDCDAGEKVLVIDLDIGNEPITHTYHKKEYSNQNLLVWNPIWWDEVINNEGDPDVEVNYRRTMARIKAAGVFLKTQWEEHKVRAVIFDGLSTLLQHAEWQMRIEKNLDVSGGVTQRYWVNRNKSFSEMIQLYKSIPLDVIFIGNYKFGLDVTKSDVAKIYRDVHDMMFQKVGFYKEETPEGRIEFIAKVDKAKQALKYQGRRVTFAVVESDETADYYWNPQKVLDLLRPDPHSQNRAIIEEPNEPEKKTSEGSLAEVLRENADEESNGGKQILGNV